MLASVIVQDIIIQWKTFKKNFNDDSIFLFENPMSLGISGWLFCGNFDIISGEHRGDEIVSIEDHVEGSSNTLSMWVDIVITRVQVEVPEPSFIESLAVSIHINKMS